MRSCENLQICCRCKVEIQDILSTSMRLALDKSRMIRRRKKDTTLNNVSLSFWQSRQTATQSDLCFNYRWFESIEFVEINLALCSIILSRISFKFTKLATKLQNDSNFIQSDLSSRFTKSHRESMKRSLRLLSSCLHVDDCLLWILTLDNDIENYLSSTEEEILSLRGFSSSRFLLSHQFSHRLDFVNVVNSFLLKIWHCFDDATHAIAWSFLNVLILLVLHWRCVRVLNLTFFLDHLLLLFESWIISVKLESSRELHSLLFCLDSTSVLLTSLSSLEKRIFLDRLILLDR